MRIAVFSDIHGNLTALDAVLDDMKRAGAFDRYWCLGDLSAFGPHAGECVQRVRQFIDAHDKDTVQVIGGNTDRYLVTGERMAEPRAKDEAAFDQLSTARRERDAMLNWNLSTLTWTDYEFLAGILHREIHLNVPDYGRVIGVHAIPGADEPFALNVDSTDEEAADALLDREGSLCLAGHTHRRMDRIVGNWRVVNPGSVGLSFTQKGVAEYAIINIDYGKVEVEPRNVPYDVDALLEAAYSNGHPSPAWLRARVSDTE